MTQHGLPGLGTSFGAAVGEYARGRPGYPPEAVAWLLGDAPLSVADVGAGTGKLTQELVRHGHSVVAIDPDATMLAALHASLPDVPTLAGTAESLPLADASVDAVVLGQAWHWVDVAAASAEAARVLRPGGALGLVWNLRDAREPWVARLTQTMRGSKAEDVIEDGEIRVAAPFGELQSATFAWTFPVTAESLAAMVRSRSLYITADDDYRAAVDADLAALIADLPGLAEGASIGLPYVTYAFRATAP